MDYLLFAAIVTLLAAVQETARLHKLRRAVRRFGPGLNDFAAYYRVTAIAGWLGLILLLAGGWLIADRPLGALFALSLLHSAAGWLLFNQKFDPVIEKLHAAELAPHKQLTEALGRQVEFEKLIAAISAGFINETGNREDKLITLALEEIARYAGVDGSAIIQFAETADDITVTHHWRSEDVAAPIGGRQVLARADLPWLLGQLVTGQLCHIADIADLPPAAAREKAFLAADGLRSLVAVPLAVDSRLLGILTFVGRQPKTWPAEYLSLLRLVGEIFAGAIRRRQTEAALRLSEAKNKAILDSVPDIMYQVNRAGRILDCKPSRHHAPAASIPAGANFTDLLPSHLVKPALDAIARTLDTARGQLFEYYRQNGETIYFEARVSKIAAEEVLIIIRDITERRRSEACDLLLLDIAVKVLEDEPLDDILTFACQHAKAVFGLPLIWVGRKEADGPVKLFTGGVEAGDTEVRWDGGPCSLGPTGAAIRTGKFQTIDLDDENMLPWRDKLKSYGSASGVSFPLRVGGTIFGALTAFAPDRAFWSKRTIVHLTSLAEQLALAINATTNRQRLRLLTTGLASAANAVAVAGQDGGIQWVNPAFLQLTGYTAGEALRENLRFLEAGGPPRGLHNSLWPFLRAGKTWQGELVGCRKDGSEYHAEMTVTPVRDETGNIVNHIAIIQDVTLRRQAEQETLEAREAISRAERLSSLAIMAAGIAHEVNQPLNSLKVAADSMLYWHSQGKTPTLAKIMENIEKISRQADRIAGIIKHMRSFVRSSQPTLPAPCDLNAAVEDSLSLLGAQLAAHGIAVQTTLAAGLPPILANATQLEEVIINLLVNAMQSLDSVSRPDKRIGIATVRRQREIILEITDNGPGISKKIKPKIFEPFFTTKPASEGMGLGLSIVHSIVTAYGGQISLKNGTKGEGVTFRVEFPVFSGQNREGLRA